MHSPLPVLGRGEPERYESPAQVAGDLNVSLLGALARADAVRGAPLALPDLLDPEAHYDAVADRIQLLAGQMPLKLLGVIGLGDDPLRFRLAANLAGRLAANGRQVTIVEAELGGPVLRHDRTPREGLLDMLLYGCSFAAVGRESGIRGVKLVSAGSHPWSGEPIHGDEWERVLGSLRQHADFTLVTTTTGLPAPILGMLARRLDSIVIAYGLHWSGREAVRRSYLALWDMDAPILGLVTEGPHAALGSAPAMAVQASLAQGRGGEREVTPPGEAPQARAEDEPSAVRSVSGAKDAPPKLGAQWARRLLGDSVEEMPPITEEVEVVIRQTSEVDAASAALWEKEVDRLRSILAAPDGVAPFADDELEPRAAAPAWHEPPRHEAQSPERQPEEPQWREPEPVEPQPAEPQLAEPQHETPQWQEPPFAEPSREARPPLPEVLHREAGPSTGSALPGERIQITFEPPSTLAPPSSEAPSGLVANPVSPVPPVPDVLQREAVPPLPAGSSAEGKIDIVVDRMFGLGAGAADAPRSGTGERRTIPVANPGNAKQEEKPVLGPAPPSMEGRFEQGPEAGRAPDDTPEIGEEIRAGGMPTREGTGKEGAPETAGAPAPDVLPPGEEMAAWFSTFNEEDPVAADVEESLASPMSLDSPLSMPSPIAAQSPLPPESPLSPESPGSPVFPALASHPEPEPPAAEIAAAGSGFAKRFLDDPGPVAVPSTEATAEAAAVAWGDTEADLPWLRPEHLSTSDSSEGLLEAPRPLRSAEAAETEATLSGLTRSELPPQVQTPGWPEAGVMREMELDASSLAETSIEAQFPEPAVALGPAAPATVDQQVIEAIEEELVGTPAIPRETRPSSSPAAKSRTPWRVFILGSLVGLAAVLFWAYRSGTIRLEPRPARQSTAGIEGAARGVAAGLADPADPGAATPAPLSGEEPTLVPGPHAAEEAPLLATPDLPVGDEPVASAASSGVVSNDAAQVAPGEGTNAAPAIAPDNQTIMPEPADRALGGTESAPRGVKSAAADVQVVGAAPRGYGVHVGSFRTPEVAGKDLARFADRGYPGLLVEVAVPGKGMWQRVVLGPYPTLAGAEKVTAEVRAAGLSPKAQSMQLKP